MAIDQLRRRRVSLWIPRFCKPFFRFVLHVFVHLKGLGSVWTTWSKLRMTRVAPLPGSMHSHHVVRVSSETHGYDTSFF